MNDERKLRRENKDLRRKCMEFRVMLSSIQADVFRLESRLACLIIRLDKKEEVRR
jgi:hypothetical protein